MPFNIYQLAYHLVVPNTFKSSNKFIYAGIIKYF